MEQPADEALAALSPTFDAMYGGGGRPSIPAERLPAPGTPTELGRPRSAEETVAGVRLRVDAMRGAAVGSTTSWHRCA